MISSCKAKWEVKSARNIVPDKILKSTYAPTGLMRHD